MDKKDELMMYAAFALMGLVARGEAPSTAAEQMWEYAQFAINYRETHDE